MEIDDGGASLKANANSTADAEWLHLDELPRPFDIVCDDLTALGALSIEDFLSNTTSAGFDVSFHLQLPELLADREKENEQEKENAGKPADDAGQEPTAAPKALKPVALLRQTGQTVFGSSDCLIYDFLEEDGKKQCILKITHPNGATRSYKSDSTFSRRGDAKSQAAQIAVDMGAIDFIVSGDSDAKKGMLLNPLDVESGNMESDGSATKPMSKLPEMDESLKNIEKCCIEWRAGTVKPHWVSFNDVKNKKKHGMALQISLNSHVFRVYAADPVHNTPWQAKLACANAAIKEGVIPFIQYGNGQTEPTKTVDNGVEDLDMRVDTPPPSTTGLTLQQFFDALPQPFPEDISEKGPSNSPTWLNLTLQSARGGRLASTFIPIIDSIRHLHGSILRIERPEETRTYLVEAQFQKRHDAKCAVCLLAMSQGVGAYIRGLKEDAENKIPAQRRKLTEKVLQVLAAECGKVRPGNRLVFNFSSERDAFGCTLRVDTSADESQPNIREYVVNTEYRCKADAKAAVAFLAAEQGLVDVLRFNNAPPPPDYVPFWEAQVNGNGDTYVPKRKGPDRDVDTEGRDRKKRKKGNTNDSEQGNTSISTPALPKPPGDLPPKPTNETLASSGYQPNARWKKPHANVSRGLGPINAYVPAPRSMGQDRSGNRSGGRPPYPQGYPSAGPPPVPGFDSRAHTHPYDDRMGYRAGFAHPSAPPYSLPDGYSNGYPAYPPAPGQGHQYPNPVYHPPAVGVPPPQPPLPPHHYSGYYGPPTPPHSSYGHYQYPPQYPPPYPHTPYSANYPPPVMYPSPTPPPPPPSSIPLPPPPASTPEQHPSRYKSRSQYPSHSHSPRSPPPLPSPMRSPPRHSHHASEYPHSYEANWQVGGNTRRRHSTIVEPRSRQNGFPPWEPELQSNYNKREPLPEDTRWKTNDRQPSPSQQHSRPPTASAEPRSIKTERDTHTPNHLSRQDVATSKSNLDLLYEFCERNKIPRPTFYHEDVQGSDGSKKYAVWAEKDAHRLEIQNNFSSIEEGYEKLSKRVLQWERSRLEGK